MKLKANEAKSYTFVFFGTDEFSVIVLDELKKSGFVPELIVTTPDRPAGRGLKLTPPPVKIWAQKNNIKFLQPEKLNGGFIQNLKPITYDLFVVASYGKIIPKEILDIPKFGALNVHPSLLPLYRGASPIQSQIIDGVEKTGVTIMLMDEQVDHGPIVAREALQFLISNFEFRKLRDELARLGGQLLAETIPRWVSGEITPEEQDNDKATYTKKITKEDGLINLNDDPAVNYRKFLAYSPTYFFDPEQLVVSGVEPGKRVKVTDAEFKDGKFIIKKVIPEGKKEIAYKNPSVS